MPGTHEELFALIALVSDPKAFKAKLDKLEAAEKANANDLAVAKQHAEEASENNRAAQTARTEATRLADKAAADTIKAQAALDKAEIAKAEAQELNEKNKVLAADLAHREKDLLSREKNFEAQLKDLAKREDLVAKKDQDLNETRARMKAVAGI
jgi:hypothetical protein